MRKLNAVEDLRAGIAEACTDLFREHAICYEVAGEHDDIGIERIDAAHHFAHERWFRVFVVVDIADLRHAKTMECLGQATQPDGLLDDFEVMPIPQAGGGDQATTGSAR